MSKNKDRTIYKREDGSWINKRNDSNRATSLHRTQKDAIESARWFLKIQGGGELTIKGVNGKIRSKQTIAPGNKKRKWRPHKRESTHAGHGSGSSSSSVEGSVMGLERRG